MFQAKIVGACCLLSLWGASATVLASDWIVFRAQSENSGKSEAVSFFYEAQNEPVVDDAPADPPPEANPDVFVAPPGAIDKPLPAIAPYGTSFNLTWNSGSGDGLGMTDLDFRQTFVFPYRKGYSISPLVGVHFLNGPESTDLPEKLYDMGLDFGYMNKVSDRWTFNLGITPSLYTDFENHTDEAFRMTGRALALWTQSPEWQFAFGVIYLDREDLAALPAVGAVWTPTPDYKIELMFPKPRVMRAITRSDTLTRWIYVGGEFAGGSWAIVRDSGANDVMTYSGLRLLVGYESKCQGKFSPRVEAGYLFNRSVEYKSGIGNFDPDNAFVFRCGGTF